MRRKDKQIANRPFDQFWARDEARTYIKGYFIKSELLSHETFPPSLGTNYRKYLVDPKIQNFAKPSNLDMQDT